MTELGNPRSYRGSATSCTPPEYPAYYLRLGEASPGYLVSRDLSSMATVTERRIPLPVSTGRVVWVVDEWHPGLPRPAALEVRALAHGRSLYVLRVRRGVVDYAGYHLVPSRPPPASLARAGRARRSGPTRLDRWDAGLPPRAR